MIHGAFSPRDESPPSAVSGCGPQLFGCRESHGWLNQGIPLRPSTTHELCGQWGAVTLLDWNQVVWDMRITINDSRANN